MTAPMPEPSRASEPLDAEQVEVLARGLYSLPIEDMDDARRFVRRIAAMAAKAEHDRMSAEYKRDWKEQMMHVIKHGKASR